VPFPNLDGTQINWVIQQVESYILAQRQRYRQWAVPLDPRQRATMEPFFSASSLNSTRVLLLLDQRVSNPAFYGELIRRGFPADALLDLITMQAITFVDTVVSHVALTPRTLFHELVHVVQYEKLGLTEFSSKYVMGS
jgi:hypothetical protein